MPQQAAIAPGPDGRKSAAKQKLSKKGKGEEPPKTDAAKDEPAKSEAAKEETSKSETAKEAAKEAGKETAKETSKETSKPNLRKPSLQAKPSPRAAKSDPRKSTLRSRRPAAERPRRCGPIRFRRSRPRPIDVGRRLQRHAGAVSRACAAAELPPAPPAVTASAPPLPPVAPAGPPAPPISQ